MKGKSSFYIMVVLSCLVCVGFGRDISGLYLTHKGTQGGQSIVEIFKYNDKYYVYGVYNLENNPVQDSCNKNPELKTRKSVGNVFAYDYVENEKGEYTGGHIYNFYNCKTYYGKIVAKENNMIDFVGALDSYYILSRAYTWHLLSKEEATKYQQYRKTLAELIPTISATIASQK